MTVPEFHSAPAENRRDHSTRDGAEALAKLIRERWAAAGHDVAVWVEHIGIHRQSVLHSDTARAEPAHFTVRSSMVNGMPTKLSVAQIAERMR